MLLLSTLVGCDHATKRWAEVALDGGPPVPVVRGVLELRHAANHDVAFSLLRAIPAETKLPWLIGVGTAIVVALLVATVRARGAALLEQLALVTTLAGAMGNVADRVVRGYVVDFIHVRHWPVFNVADVLLVVGVGLFVLAARRPAPVPASEHVTGTSHLVDEGQSGSDQPSSHRDVLDDER